MSYRPASRMAIVGEGRQHRPDYSLIVLPLVLLVMGLVVVYAISPGLSAIRGVGDDMYFVKKQLIAIFLGIAAFLFFSRVSSKLWRIIGVFSGLLGLLTSIITVIVGIVQDAPTRWIQIGGLSFQPAELVKFALILLVAEYLGEQVTSGAIRQKGLHLLKPLVIVMAVVGMIVIGLQHDLGSAVVMFAIVGMMIMVAGFPMRKILMITIAILALSAIAVASTPYRRERVANFLHPDRDIQGSGYHINQALIAVGSGGVLGRGLGNSVQATGYLPEAANDSIFAVYAEIAGFVGSLLLLVIYGMLLRNVLQLSNQIPNMRTRLVVVGVATWLGVQASMNIGAMIGVLPLKGITLPLVSFGGTSMIFVMAALGLMFYVSRYTDLGATGRKP